MNSTKLRQGYCVLGIEGLLGSEGNLGLICRSIRDNHVPKNMNIHDMWKQVKTWIASRVFQFSGDVGTRVHRANELYFENLL